jgi:hypothetical protein
MKFKPPCFTLPQIMILLPLAFMRLKSLAFSYSCAGGAVHANRGLHRQPDNLTASEVISASSYERIHLLMVAIRQLYFGNKSPGSTRVFGANPKRLRFDRARVDLSANHDAQIF